MSEKYQANTQHEQTSSLSAYEQAINKRGDFLRATLGTDYDHILESGVIDLFHIDTETGEDGLLHTLVGDSNGGFHSLSAVTLNNEGTNGTLNTELTKERLGHLENSTQRRKNKFKRRTFEPYLAQVAINGIAKKVVTVKNGESKPIEQNNTMYPEEYDVVTTLKAIEQAYFNRDPSEDNEGNVESKVLNKTGFAMMLDGVSRMGITLVLDKNTKRIVTAMPENDRRGYMNLNNEQAHDYLFN